MIKVLPILTLLFSNPALAQPLTPDSWERESKTNNRLLPKYGDKIKSDEEKASDQQFVDKVLSMDEYKGDRRAASNHMIELGFNYLYRGNHKTAMYRYNQAYLLDSSNIDIYWGYSAFFFTIGHYQKSKEQLVIGLSIDSTNVHLLTDMGTYYLAQYYGLQPTDEDAAINNLDIGIKYFHKSYGYDPKYESTSFKLSICYWIKEDCANAWLYYKKCKALGGKLITEEFTKDLKKRCRKRK